MPNQQQGNFNNVQSPQGGMQGGQAPMNVQSPQGGMQGQTPINGSPQQNNQQQSSNPQTSGGQQQQGSSMYTRAGHLSIKLCNCLVGQSLHKCNA